MSGERPLPDPDLTPNAANHRHDLDTDGGGLSTAEELIAYNLRGMGARIAPDWVDLLRLEHGQAAERRAGSTHAAGTHPR